MSQSLISSVEWHDPSDNKDSNPAGCSGEVGPLEEQTDGCSMAANPLLTPGERLHMAAVKVQAVVKFTRMQKLKRRARWLTKKLIVFVLSQVGLTFLVVLYAIAGGFIFQALEYNPNQHNSSEARPESIIYNLTIAFNLTLQQLGSLYADRMWNRTESYNILYPDEWKRDALQQLQQFAWDVYSTALLDLKDTEMDNASATTPGELADSYQGSSTETEEQIVWTYPRSLLFAVTVITTIGYGDTVPRSLEAKMACMVYATFGIPMTLLCLANIGSLMATVYKFTWKHISHLALIIARSPARNEPKPSTSEVRVPVAICLATMTGYILGGAVLFSTWEGWSYTDGSYFCFVTLSTIGFGDFVPGKKGNTFDSNSKRVVCALYLLFGLALLSMVFQLIQDSVLVIVSRYASLLGLSDSKIEKDIEDCSDTAKLQCIPSEDLSNETHSFTGEKDSGDKTLGFPVKESTGDGLSGETYQRFLDVAKSVRKNQQQSVSPVAESKKKQLKVTYKLHPVSKDRASNQGYNKVNAV